jgi:hypothetical protein
MPSQITIPEGSWFPGAAAELVFDVVDDADHPQNMTGWDLAFIVSNGRDVVLQLTTDDEGDKLTIVDGAGTNDRAIVAIAPADTAGLRSGQYVVALWRTDGESDIPLAYGPATLTPVATPPPPEEP